MLTKQQISEYEERGYLVVPDVIDGAKPLHFVGS